MSDSGQGEVSRLLGAVRAGDAEARNHLFTLIHDELHDLAKDLMKEERPDHTLQPSALLDEAFIRLVDQEVLAKAPNRRYVFAAAARAMRQILVEHARKRKTERRGGNYQRLRLDAVLDYFEQQNLNVLKVHEALEELGAIHERQSQIMTLRYFGGFTLEEIAKQLQVSVATVSNDYRIARAWLHKKLHDSGK
jgi:RNA polymerase sigma-70 factor, ECF subfamily